MAKDDKNLTLTYKLIISVMGSFGLMLVVVAGIFIFVDKRTPVPADLIYFTIQAIWFLMLIYQKSGDFVPYFRKKGPEK